MREFRAEVAGGRRRGVAGRGGARCRIEPECGHFAWLERPGSVRQAPDSIT